MSTTGLQGPASNFSLEAASGRAQLARIENKKNRYSLYSWFTDRKSCGYRAGSFRKSETKDFCILILKLSFKCQNHWLLQLPEILLYWTNVEKPKMSTSNQSNEVTEFCVGHNCFDNTFIPMAATKTAHVMQNLKSSDFKLFLNF